MIVLLICCKQLSCPLVTAQVPNDEVSIKHGDLCARSTKEYQGNVVQTYRNRLIEAEIIASAGRDKLAFAVPYLCEYLRDES